MTTSWGAMAAVDEVRDATASVSPELFRYWDQLVHHRRSIRGFDDSRDVPDSHVEKILECARWAPSAGNSQPWEFIVIRDVDTRRRIADYYVKDRAVSLEIEQEARGGNLSSGATFATAPVLILIVGDPRSKEALLVRSRKERPETSFVSSLANVTYTIHLTAASLGLACQYVTSVQSPYMDTVLKKLLNIPEPLRCYEMTPIGWPIKWPKGPDRRPLEEIVHRESYETEKARTDEDVRNWVYKHTRRANRKMLRTDAE